MDIGEDRRTFVFEPVDEGTAPVELPTEAGAQPLAREPEPAEAEPLRTEEIPALAR